MREQLNRSASSQLFVLSISPFCVRYISTHEDSYTNLSGAIVSLSLPRHLEVIIIIIIIAIIITVCLCQLYLYDYLQLWTVFYTVVKGERIINCITWTVAMENWPKENKTRCGHSS